ncbi:MAG: hypothetical protein GC208_10365 [Alphaproteobacteria bacterium]|nr:hypothetical protein [Alphaproteobacteria bacterium]
MARTTEEITEDIATAEAELADLASMPTKFTVYGQTIDNTDRIDYLRRRLRSLRAELNGTSVMQGPDLIV